jgi:hypothetical protein
VLVVWGSRGDLDHAAAHRQVVEAAVATPGPTVVEVPVALEDTTKLVEAAGEVVAWGGLAASP